MITGRRFRAINGIYEACKGLTHAENENKDFISVKFPNPISVSLKYRFDEGYRMIAVKIEEIWVDLLYQEVTIFDHNPKDGALFEWSANKIALPWLNNLADAIRLYKYL